MFTRFALVAAALAIALPASAHSGHVSATGFLHPLSGFDHVLAMVAVGLWAAFTGGRAVWLVPSMFVASMLGGFALAVAGTGLPAVEPGIAASVLILGLLLAAAVRLPLGASMALVGLFAVFHGHAHGVALIDGHRSAVLVFALGFVASTVLLHLAGIALARMLGRSRDALLVRGVGGAVAVCGLVLLGGWA